MTRRGRKPGNPLRLFDTDRRTAFLELLAAGMYLKDAAVAVGVAPRTARHAAALDAVFAAKVADAEASGRQTRIDAIPHGEYRYNHHACRCDLCRKAATTARAARPDRAPDDPEQPADTRPDRQDPTPMPTPLTQPSPTMFPLARAS